MAMIYVIGILGVLLLLCIFPRQMIAIGAVVTVLALFIAGYWFFEDRSAKRDQVAVVIGVEYSTSGDCGRDYPLRVSIVNLSDKVVERAQWQFVARLSGHSSNLVQRESFIHSDRILRPGESAVLCFSLPSLGAYDSAPARLDWAVKDKWIMFMD